MTIIDAHLDIAYNAVHGRDVLLPASQQKTDEGGIPTVGLPDLRQAGVRLVCATIFCEPSIDGKPGYTTPDEAHEMAQRQARWYLAQSQEEQFNIITTPGSLELDESPFPDAIDTIILMEGADAIRSPAEIPIWHDLGVRIVGLAWKRTRYAGGTGAPGPLTPEGVALVRELDTYGMIHDTSHLAEESFWDLVNLTGGPLIASHSNCRGIVPTDRQLTDDMIRAIGQREGIIGINFFDKFLLPPEEYGKRRATLADVAAHVSYICDVLGDAHHIGLGTDMDGGLGREQIPVEIQSSADLPRVADALSKANFSDPDIAAIMGGNWMRFFRNALPGRS